MVHITHSTDNNKNVTDVSMDKEISKGLFFRYIFYAVTAITLQLFQKILPSDFVLFMYVCYVVIAANALLHACLHHMGNTPFLMRVFSFFDIIISPVILYFSGGILSPFIIFYLFSTYHISRLNIIASSRLPAVLLFCSYFSVALLHYTGILPDTTLLAIQHFYAVPLSVLIVVFTSIAILLSTRTIDRYSFLKDTPELTTEKHDPALDRIRLYQQLLLHVCLKNGEEFFSQCSNFCIESLRIHHVIITRKVENDLFETIHQSDDTAQHTKKEFTLSDTFLSDVAITPESNELFLANPEMHSDDPFSFLENISEIFGYRVQNAANNTIGYIYLLSSSPITNKDLFREIVSHLIPKIAVEILSFNSAKENIKSNTFKNRVERMETVSKMAAHVAHDFNNMISAISGYASLLKKRLSKDDRAYTFVEHIIEAGKHASELSSQLSLLVINDKPRSEPFNVSTVITDTVHHLLQKFPGLFKITTTLSSDPIIVKGDRAFFESIVEDIGLNACDACAPGSGEISFSTALLDLGKDDSLTRIYNLTPGHFIRISISDNGSGIQKNILLKIFDPFYSTKGKSKGVGLGLSYLLNYVITYSGAVDVSPSENGGTQFKIYLPCTIGKKTQKISSNSVVTEQRPTETDIHSGSILIVDDEPSVREIYSEVLNEYGFVTYTCSDGKDAIEFIRKGFPSIDLVVLDMIMEHVSGPETFQRIHSFKPDLKFLFMSGMTDSSQLHDLLKYPCTRFLQKPCDNVQLLNHITSLMKFPCR